MPDISICSLLHNSEKTRAGPLDGFFRHLTYLEEDSGVSVERIVLVDDRSTDGSFEIAKTYCDPEHFHFEDFSQARNLLLERATGNWVLMAEPDMRFEDEVGNILAVAEEYADIDCIDAIQQYYSPGEQTKRELFYFMMRPSVRYQGLVFESVKVFPDKMRTFNTVLAQHYVRKREDRMRDVKGLSEKEIKQIEQVRDDPTELYWGAMRYFELGSMSLPFEHTMNKCIDMLRKAISLKPDFGAAYFELGKFYMTFGKPQEALDVAREGLKIGYELCLPIIAVAQQNRGS